MVKDGCNNAEKNRILLLFDQDNKPEAIARGMGLTLRIVENMIWYYREGGKEEKEAESKAAELETLNPDEKPEKVKAKSKAKKKSKATATAEEDFK